MFDWPGLVAPQVIKVRREKQTNQFATIFELKPEWVVLRDFEYEDLGSSFEHFGESIRRIPAVFRLFASLAGSA